MDSVLRTKQYLTYNGTDTKIQIDVWQDPTVCSHHRKRVRKLYDEGCVLLDSFVCMHQAARVACCQVLCLITLYIYSLCTVIGNARAYNPETSIK